MYYNTQGINFGAEYRDRTRDILRVKEALYHLSYAAILEFLAVKAALEAAHPSL